MIFFCKFNVIRRGLKFSVIHLCMSQLIRRLMHELLPPAMKFALLIGVRAGEYSWLKREQWWAGANCVVLKEEIKPEGFKVDTWCWQYRWLPTNTRLRQRETFHLNQEWLMANKINICGCRRRVVMTKVGARARLQSWDPSAYIPSE